MAANIPPGIGGFFANLEQDTFNAFRLSLISLGLIGSAGEIADIVTNKEKALSFEALNALSNLLSAPIGTMEEIVGKPLFDLLIAAPAGLEFSTEPGAQEADAVVMIQRMLGFAAALPWVTGQIRSTLKLALGEHAPEPLLEAIGKMAEELGVNFFIGTVIERIFETAVSRPLEEAIAEQRRPARLEWPQLRALARQHAISTEDLADRLRKTGFRDVDLPLVEAIDRTRLTVADLQQVALWRIRDEPWIRDYMGQIGIDGEDEDIVWEIALQKVDTQGGTMLRSVAQQAYLNGAIGKDQYLSYLATANVPPASIDLEVQAADLAREVGRKQLSFAEVKKLHADGAIDDAQAYSRLESEGYSLEDAVAVVKDWHFEKSITKPGLTENRILAYLAAGVLTKAEAYSQLIALHIDPQQATFLVDHPTTAARVAVHGLTSGTIVSAYKDGVISRTVAEQKLLEAHVAQDEIDLLLRVADVSVNRGPKPRAAHKTLSEAEIMEALKNGLATAQWCHRELVTLGWSDADAALLVQIELTKLQSPDAAGWVKLT